MEIWFEVQGSAEAPYIVSFKKNGKKFSTECTCPAGQNGIHCKHRIRILNGNSDGIISGNKCDIDTIVSWLQDSDISEVLQALSVAEKQFENAKKELNITKKKLDRALIG